MDTDSLIGAPDADIMMYNKGGRDSRYERLTQGKEAPREFFYGLFDLERLGLSVAMSASTGYMPGLIGAAVNAAEHMAVSGTNFGVRPWSARRHLARFEKTKVVVSYTDGFSLSLGLAPLPRARQSVIIGGFHGLSDIEPRVVVWARPLARRMIRRSLAGLDHVFFFGPADREFAISRYGLSRERSSIFKFGVDTDFWRPLSRETAVDFVVAVGQDRNRDYDLLAAAPVECEVRILTRQPVVIPPGACHVKTTVGDYFGTDAMTDEDLRRLYNMAAAVIVPLKDVYQPSGYSVTLQAMSCARPVIISNIRGLWSNTLKHDVNCLMVPPGDAPALAVAINRIMSDKALASRLGQAARETALAHFGLDTLGYSTVALARRGLDLWTQRRAKAVS